jgi:hypothetical protein
MRGTPQMGVFQQPVLGLGHQPGSKAARADSHPHGPAFFDGFHPLEIRIPSGSGFVVRVAHIETQNRLFPANIAHFGHDSSPLEKQKLFFYHRI